MEAARPVGIGPAGSGHGTAGRRKLERGSLRVPAIRRKGTMRSGTATLLTDESRAPIPEHKTPLAMTRGEKENLREGNF